MRIAAFLSLALSVLIAAPLAADDLAFVSAEELEGEIAARDEDIDRTRRRIAALEGAARRAREEIDRAARRLREVERKLGDEAALLYRLSRHGHALRYLLGAGSPTELLERLGTLRRLVLHSLEERRRAGMKLAAAEERLAAAKDDRRRAEEMLDRLRRTRRDLLAELQRRAGSQPALP
ncbi:MAG: hypothetical protein R6V85_21575 [Polyangia bacterium]